MSDVLELTVAQAASRIEAGELSADEYGDACAAAAAGDDLNAYLWTRGAAGPRTDRRPRTAGALAGVPVAIKDLFCTEGVPTTAGSRILEGYRPPYTATAVRRLEAAGAQVLGKTNMDEFGMGSSNENSGYGPVLQPVGSGARAGRLLGRLGRGGGGAAALRARSAPTPAGRSASRRRCAGSSA